MTQGVQGEPADSSTDLRWRRLRPYLGSLTRESTFLALDGAS